MIRRRGKNAAIHATQRALGLQAQGELAAASIWHRVANEIARIRTDERDVYAASLALFNPERIELESI
ncbi:MAG TPA: hypothetical protein VGR52_10640 [Stellaceae bacterium]|nr:hypothetical protein [Stellaceae bacterium]